MFRPLLAPNEEPDYNTTKYPLLASYKMDGIRCIFKEGRMISRRLKDIPNKQLQLKYDYLKKFSKDHKVILDGELYSHGHSLHEIDSFVMTQDFTSKKSIKRYGKIIEIPESLQYYCFDYIIDNNFSMDYMSRIKYLEQANIKDIVIIGQTVVLNAQQVEELMQKALQAGYEGLILRDLMGVYKMGRGTLNEGIIYKKKPFRTFDGQIKGVTQATIANPKAKKEINELGYSKTSSKKGDRIPIEMAKAFIVDFKRQCSKCKGKGCITCNNTGVIVVEVKPTIDLPDSDKIEIYKNKEKYIGRWIEYKAMLVGSKDKPRHSGFLRFIDPRTK